MTEKEIRPDPAADLRCKAEEIIRKNDGQSPVNDGDTLRQDVPIISQTLHELRVHQIELEMQNDALRRRQEELDAARARYFDLYDLAPVGYVTVDEQGLVLEANLTAANMLGVVRGDLVQQPLSLLILKEDQDVYFLFRKQLFETGELQECELRMTKRGSSQTFWVHLEATVAKDLSAGPLLLGPRQAWQAGEPVGRIVMSDITKRKLKEANNLLEKTVEERAKQLRQETEARERPQEILQEEKDIVLLVDDEPHVLSALTRSLRNTGYEILTASSGNQALEIMETTTIKVIVSDEQMIGMKGSELLAEVRQRFPHTLRMLLTGHATLEGATRAVNEGGIYRFFTKPWDDALLSLALSAAIEKYNSDAEKRRLQDALQQSEKRLRAITDFAQDAILMMDQSGNITYWNPAAGRLFGYTYDEAIGQNLHQLIAPQRYHTTHNAAFARFQLTGQGDAIGSTLELEACHKNGHEIPVELSLSSLFLNGGWHSVGIVRNITDRKQADEALRKAKEGAEEASRAKSEFLAGMSHEIRTPMNAIVGMADLLIESELTAEQRIYAETSRNAGENLLELINSILDLSKVEAGLVVLEKAEFDLPSVMNNVCDLISLKATGKGIRVACAPLSNIPAVLIGDSQRLSQIFINLVGNALKFTEQGEIILGVERIDGRPDSADRESIELRFFVRDTGIGISLDKAELIFDMFTQADSSTTRKYGGTGLGLHISKHFVELMGGRIWVESEVGKGSTFFFTATFGVGKTAKPIAEKGEMASSGDVPPVMQRSMNILLVEDNADNRLLMLSYFRKTPHHIDVAENGAIAVEKFQTGGYDLVLMDVQMPVMDGYTATAEIRKLEAGRGLKRTPIVALTAHAMKEDEQKSRDAGCDGHFTKPIRKAVLLEAIAKYGVGLSQGVLIFP